MKRLAFAGFAVFMCSLGYAQDNNTPVTLNRLYEELGKLVGQYGERYLEELSIVIAPEEAEPLLLGDITPEPGAEGRLIIKPVFNFGECTGTPMRKYINNLGFYLIEFCDSNAAHVWGDIHRLGNASGALGRLVETDTFFCNQTADLVMMPPKARHDFCAN
jgi:hypothetical protein